MGGPLVKEFDPNLDPMWQRMRELDSFREWDDLLRAEVSIREELAKAEREHGQPERRVTDS